MYVVVICMYTGVGIVFVLVCNVLCDLCDILFVYECVCVKLYEMVCGVCLKKFFYFKA